MCYKNISFHPFKSNTYYENHGNIYFGGYSSSVCSNFAQEHRISVEVKNGTFYEVVSQIEKQSKFMFFYKSEEIDNNQRINLNVKNKLVSEILNEITKNNNLTYKITGKHIILTKLSSENQDLKKNTGRIKDNSGEPL